MFIGHVREEDTAMKMCVRNEDLDGVMPEAYSAERHSAGDNMMRDKYQNAREPS